MQLSDTWGDEKDRSRLLEALRSLVLFHGIAEGEVGWALQGILDPVVRRQAQEGAVPDPELFTRELFKSLAEEIELSRQPLAGNPWQSHLLNRLLKDENPFSLKAQLVPPEELSPALLRAAAADLSALQVLFRISLDVLSSPDGAASPDGLRPLSPTRPEDPATAEMKRELLSSADWSALVPRLASYFHSQGAGIFREYRAFRWLDGDLQGIAEPDPICLDDLIAYDAERELLLRNTEYFVRGFPANNVLVYGERGTGKSSTVKALLHAYADRGLRMVEVPKAHLSDFTEILHRLRGRRERFVLFVDDLSFEEDETTYKDLKAVLEGGLEARPENVLLYATSNRKHLIKERFSERHLGLADDEVHYNDTMEEKLSLSDRFGITLVFLAPDQKRYLRIVRGLAERRGILLPPEELESRAIMWVQQHNERSGRTARQFIDYLTAEAAAVA
ncbi:MAG TPA: ATP-binding protein [Armatimonadota bacterium]